MKTTERMSRRWILLCVAIAAVAIWGVLPQAFAQDKIITATELVPAEEPEADGPSWEPALKEVAVIDVGEDLAKSSTTSFCIGRSGTILAACTPKQTMEVRDEKTNEIQTVTVMNPGEIRAFAPDGKHVATWPLGFAPQAINVGPDGTIYVGGGGTLAKLSPDGKELARADSPGVEALMPDPETLMAGGADSAQAKVVMLKQQIERMETYLKEGLAQREAAMEKAIAKAKEKGDTDQAEEMAKMQAQMKESMLATVKRYQEQLTEAQAEAKAEAERQAAMTPEDRELLLKVVTEQARQIARGRATITGIAANGQDVFVTCRGRSGYAVYRTDLDFAEPVKIIDRLSGCCGQMDVQTLGDEVYVPENARHRVSRYKRDGEMIASFGSHDRKRADGFGGCCEPKNLCFDAQGNILAAESGTPVLIKRFSPAGEFIEVVARPVFTTGCVRVTIGMDHASGRVYMLEGAENKIHAFGDPREVPTHQQVAILSATGEESSGRIATLCTAAGGNLLVACNGASGGEIRVINPEGEMVDTWKLDFAPQAINTSADGTVFVGGGGQIAKLDAQGKVLATADSPAVEALMPNPEDFLSGGPESAQAKAKVLAQRVASMEKSLDEDRLAQQRAMYDRLIAQYKEKGDTQRAEVYTQAKAQIKERMLASVNRYREQLAEAEAAAKEEAKQQESMTPEQREAAMKEAVEKAREVARQRATVTGIAVGGKDVFISCRGRSGYTVYRTDPSLGNSVKIVDRLSGCCGQMDIQAHQGDLWVAANTRGQVIRYDRNGKRLASWGKLDRKSVEGFGSCCNPMNIRFGSDGMVYTSEASLGRIKRFTLDGEFLGVVGTAKIVPGCKHAPIGISPDGDRVYLLDITRSHIVTLAKDAPDAEKVASRESTERVEE